MKLLVSACLLGHNCKYNGGNNDNAKVHRFLADKEYIIFCPESASGLPCPRDPAEIQGEAVIDRSGQDVTEYFHRGAQMALELCQKQGIDTALLKESSPSCGSHLIYDGTFSKKKLPGLGITARLLAAHGIRLLSEEDLD